MSKDYKANPYNHGSAPTPTGLYTSVTSPEYMFRADIYARYLSGRSPVTHRRQRRARRANHTQSSRRGRDSQDIVDRYHKLIKDSFDGPYIFRHIFPAPLPKYTTPPRRNSSAISTTRVSS